MGFLQKIFPSDNDRQVKKIERIAAKVEALQEEYKALSDAELKAKTTELKKWLAEGKTLQDILPHAFATVREASARVLNMRHFHVQLLGGIALFQGRIAEMRTGEGKTLVETLPAYLMALTGKGVHIVTVNEYLAQRDAEWMGKIFKYLGLTVGVTLAGQSPSDKRQAYNCDITYGTNNEFGFDYLRDNMVVRLSDRVARGYHFAIVDEVDSILIDEARTPLIISGMGMKSAETYKTAARFVKNLQKTDYEIDEKEKAIRLTENGVTKAERFFKVANLSDIENIEINHHINNGLRAQYIMKNDVNYIVQDGEVVIVDENTGRLMVGRKYSNGLHQAIEAKEGVEVRDENQTLATITFQNFFRIYNRLSGMTGTAKTEEIEFNKIYKLDVVCIPTNLPIMRTDYPDIIYITEEAKYKAVIEEIKRISESGRPVLVGTISIEKSEYLSKELKHERVKHCVLNAKNHQQESEIIAQAGRLGAVTIATNMAGRGTDILLGGNPEFLAKQKMRELGLTEAQIDFCTSFNETDNEELNAWRNKYREKLAEYKKHTDAEKKNVIALGGLHIIGTERHESRRIDNQLRGRAGRQGDPGSSVFYVSMEDDLIRRFGGETMQKMMRFFHVDENTPFQYPMLSRRIEGAQRRIEGFHFGARSSILRYDDVMNVQRSIVYEQRNRVLEGANLHNEIIDMIHEFAINTVYENVDESKMYDEWDLNTLNDGLNTKLFEPDYNYVTEQLMEEKEAFTIEKLANVVAEECIRKYEEKCQGIKDLHLSSDAIEGSILLRVVDSLWMTHIDYMNMLRSEIGLRAYGNHDPFIAYKQEGSDAFDNMIETIRKEVAMFLLHVKIDIKIQPKQEAPKALVTNSPEAPKSAKSQLQVGRNEFCTCGSGKKYKHCCGKND